MMERQREIDLSGKVVIITGASRDVGKQAALDFARRGAYPGRLFWAEREMADMGIELGEEGVVCPA